MERNLTVGGLQIILEDSVRDLIDYWKVNYGWELKPTAVRLVQLKTYGADNENRGVDDYVELGPAGMLANIMKSTYVPVNEEAEPNTPEALPFQWNEDHREAKVRYPADALRYIKTTEVEIQTPRGRARVRSRFQAGRAQSGYETATSGTVSEVDRPDKEGFLAPTPKKPRRSARKKTPPERREKEKQLTALQMGKRKKSKSRSKTPERPPDKPDAPESDSGSEW